MSLKVLQYIFLDFDETMFKHRSFIDWVDDYLHSAGYLNKGKGSFKAKMDNYHDIISEIPLLRLYKHEEHLRDTTNQTWFKVAKELQEQVDSQKLDFCYPDTHELLKWLKSQPQDLRILTFGSDEYQRFKIDTCHCMKENHIPIHVVAESKADFLAKHFGKGRGVLVDDKYPLKLPKNWHHIWIDRKAGLDKPLKMSDRETKISRLDQVEEVLGMTLN